MPQVQINGIDLHFVDVGEGEGPPLVLIHGFPLSHAMWQPQIDVFRSRVRVIAPDIRGLGRSDPGDGQSTMELFVDDLLGLLDHLGIEEAVLCGLSMGGYIALRLTERCPERVVALALCDTRSEADTDEAKVKRANAIRAVKADGVAAFAQAFLPTALAPRTPTENPALVERLTAIITANSPLGIAGCLLAMAARTDTTGGLSSIRVPTLLLVGEEDGLTPPALAESMASSIAGARLAVIPGAGHLSNLENPDEFNCQVGSLLGSL